MKFITLIATAFLFFSLNINESESKCLADTTTWCDSIQNAIDCNVLEQCHKFVWSGDLVNLTLFYETLCPDCREFISGQVWQAFNSINSIMNLTLVPYGNAKETYRQETKLWQFTCQHGADECWGNLLHSCLIKYYPRQEDHLPFIYCMESNNNATIEDAAGQCSIKLNISMNQLTQCMYSVEGNVVQHNYALMTESLNPPHKYVPWVTLNGVHTEEIQNKAQDDLIGLICDSFKGTKPAGCNKKKSVVKI